MGKPLVFEVAWGNPYTTPPNGKPRVLGRVICDPSQLPFDSSKLIGYSLVFISRVGVIDKPRREWTPERKAAMRRRNLERRAEKKAPLFAADIVANELARRPDYFAGGTFTKVEIKRPRREAIA